MCVCVFECIPSISSLYTFHAMKGKPTNEIIKVLWNAPFKVKYGQLGILPPKNYYRLSSPQKTSFSKLYQITSWSYVRTSRNFQSQHFSGNIVKFYFNDCDSLAMYNKNSKQERRKTSIKQPKEEKKINVLFLFFKYLLKPLKSEN